MAIDMPYNEIKENQMDSAQKSPPTRQEAQQMQACEELGFAQRMTQKKYRKKKLLEAFFDVTMDNLTEKLPVSHLNYRQR